MNESLTNCILVVGPEFKNHRGGVGAVISSHQKYFNKFHFFCTYNYLSRNLQPFYSLYRIFYFPIYLLMRPGIKIVHIHGASYGSFYRKYLIFLASKYLLGRKVIYHMHGGQFHTFYENSPFLIKKCIRHFIDNADMMLCLSKQWFKYFNTTFQPKRLEVLPNFVEPVSPDIKFPNRHNQKLKLLFLGKFDKNKGIYDLIEVIKKMRTTRNGQFELRIGGNGETEEVKKIIQRNDLGEHIKYLGWISGQEKDNALAETDIFILPSYNEGLPVSILEAMSNAKPVIATNVGGIPEVVEDKKSGYLFEPGDLNGLRESIEKFMDDRSLIETLGEYGREIFENQYTSGIVIKKLEGIYNLVLNDNKCKSDNVLQPIPEKSGLI